MSAPIDTVLSRLEGHKLREDGRDRWRACGVCHGGSNPSALSIGLSENGAVLLRCWSGCSIEAICAGLGIGVGDLFPPKRGPGEGIGPAKRRRMLTAGQALALLHNEAMVIWVIACDMRAGKTIGEDDHERLTVAAARIGELLAEART
jgi:hypothetical protein